MDECDVIDMLSEVREEIADPFPAFAILLEIPSGFYDPSRVLVAAATKCFDFDRLIISPFHGGLVIECVDVAGATVHEQEDDVFGFGGEVRLRMLRRIGGSCASEKTILGQ
jgi:hypothetical protein